MPLFRFSLISGDSVDADVPAAPGWAADTTAAAAHADADAATAGAEPVRVPLAALRAAATMLKPSGTIYITQTFQRRNVPGLSMFKPMMKYLTTIDFGQLVFEPEVVHIVESAQMEVIENIVIPNSVNNPMQVARLLVVKPKTSPRSKSPMK